MRKLLFLMVALLSVLGASGTRRAGESPKVNIMSLPPFERAVIIIKKYETMHNPKHWPYIGYGHRVQPGEPYRRGCQLTESQADALLRKDLRKFIAHFAQYGKDSTILGVLAYNIGPGAVHKSSVVKKLKRGDRNIYKSYTSHCRYKGKWHRQLHERRCIEFAALFLP